MIKPLLITALVSTPALADEEPTYCESIAELAEAVMTKRQAGVPLVDMMKISDEPVAVEIFKLAYKRRQYPEGYRQGPITDFQNDIYLECLTATDK